MGAAERQGPTRRGVLTGLAGLAAWAAPQALAQEAPPSRFFRIASGPSGGIYYPLAGLIAAAISNPTSHRACEVEAVCGIPGLLAVAQTSSGSIANLHRLLKGDVESAFCQADLARRAAQGTLPSVSGLDGSKLRAIAYLFPEYLHIVVHKDSSIRTLADLADHSLALGSFESGTRIVAEVFLKVADLEDRLSKAPDLSPIDAAYHLRKGSLDAFLAMAGVPDDSVESLAQDRAIRLLPFRGQAAARFTEAQPPFEEAAILGGIYDSLPVTPTVAVGALWLVADTLEEELVYAITEALWSKDTEVFLKANGGYRVPRLNADRALKDIGVPPLHPGAARFYKKSGRIA
ncbi:MAG: TAXI family TRAP transporter solute-binding subunit [Rhodospirillales bacterium]|nr:TAXI family TRAP transporter solute-binding subunit [Rhodospirillales bacterium]